MHMGTKKELDLIDQQVIDILADAIEDAGITYRRIREITGMSINRIGIILRKESPPATIGELDKLARAAGITASQLLLDAESLSQAEFTIAARDSDDDEEAEAQAQDG